MHRSINRLQFSSASVRPGGEGDVGFKPRKKNTPTWSSDTSHPHDDALCLETGIKKQNALTMPCKAGGGDEALAQGFLSLIGYRPVVSEDPTLQLIQVGGGELHAAPGAVPVLIIASLQQTDQTNTLPQPEGDFSPHSSMFYDSTVTSCVTPG